MPRHPTALTVDPRLGLPVRDPHGELLQRVLTLMMPTPSISLLNSMLAWRSRTMGAVTSYVGECDVLQVPKEGRVTTFPRLLVLDREVCPRLNRLATDETLVAVAALHELKHDLTPQPIDGRSVGHAKLVLEALGSMGICSMDPISMDPGEVESPSATVVTRDLV